MSEIQVIISALFVVMGIIFMLMGSIGILRLPDFFARTHAVSKSDTIGIIFVIFGLIIYEGFSPHSVKLFFIILFIALSNPIGSHALGKAAIKSGLKPFFSSEKKEDKKA
jgi:multicomponent Na+:H+ antiporter subunit G